MGLVGIIYGKGQGRQTVKTSLVRHVVDEEDAHRAAVVGCCDGAEALLPGGVPYLQFDTLAVEVDGADLEVDADGGDEGGGEAVFAEPEEAARFAHARVADQEEFYL
jgi:hypothetical protein